MKIDGIYSIREHQGKVYTDIVTEWEEDLSRLNKTRIKKWGHVHNIASRLIKIRTLEPLIKRMVFGKDRKYLRFVMNAMEDTPLFNHKSCVPIIIDYFVKKENISDFISIYDKCEYVFISSRHAYEDLTRIELPFKIVHFPLAISDRYLCNERTTYVKKFSFAVLGTQIYDPHLKTWLEKYCREHPGFIYVYKDKANECYYTNTGEFVCDARDRDKYMKLLRQSKVVFYSTPGIRGRLNVNGYDQVTPKVLEMLASQCHVIMRYSDNPDTRYFELDKLSESIDEYSQFEKKMDCFLCSDFDKIAAFAYLSKHTTSKMYNLLNTL